MTKTNTVFAANGEWSGYSIRAARTGWVVSLWSRIQGSVDGRVTLHAYTDQFPRGTDLEKPWNDFVSTGEALRETAPVTKVMKSGHKVQ